MTTTRTIAEYRQLIEQSLSSLKEQEPEEYQQALDHFSRVQDLILLELDGLATGQIQRDLHVPQAIRCLDQTNEPITKTIERFLEAAYAGTVVGDAYYAIVQNKVCGCWYFHKMVSLPGGERDEIDVESDAMLVSNGVNFWIKTRVPDGQWSIGISPIEDWLGECYREELGPRRGTLGLILRPNTNIRFLLYLQLLVEQHARYSQA